MNMIQIPMRQLSLEHLGHRVIVAMADATVTGRLDSIYATGRERGRGSDAEYVVSIAFLQIATDHGTEVKLSGLNPDMTVSVETPDDPTAPTDSEPDTPLDLEYVAVELDLVRYAEKHGATREDAYRYFERQGYDMSQVT